MALTSDDFRQLRSAVEDMTRVIKEQADRARGVPTDAEAMGSESFTFSRQGPQDTLGRNVGRRNYAAGGQEGESSPLMGFATSIGRSLGQSTGPIGNAISNIAQGAAQGGAAGAAAAAGQEIIKAASAQGAAGQQGVLASPLFSGSGREAFEARFRQRSQALEAERAVDAPFEAFGFKGPAQALRGALGFQTADPTQAQRQLDEDRARRTFVADAAVSQVEPFVGAVAAAGGQFSNQQLSKILQVSQKQNKARQEVHERLVKMSNEMAGFTSDERLNRM